VDQNKRLKKERNKGGKSKRTKSPYPSLPFSFFHLSCPVLAVHTAAMTFDYDDASRKHLKSRNAHNWSGTPSVLPSCAHFLTVALKNGAERGKGRLWTLKLPREQLRVAGHFRDGVSVQRPLQAWHFLPVVRGLSPELSCPVKAPFFFSRFSPVVPVFLLHTT